MAAEIALYHHENGTVCILRQEGKKFPARITSIADVFDAWTSERGIKA